MSKVQKKANLLIQIFFRKKADICEAEFHGHWSTFHASLAVEPLLKHGIIGYTQDFYHCPKATRSLVEKAAGIQSSQVYSSSTLLDFDAAVMITVKDVKALVGFLEDSAYRTVIAQDEFTFVDSRTLKSLAAIWRTKLWTER
ncbi:hypothetical protein LTR46_001114 [Exophiala xenobiotica]|nr:hypothetical protein LTR46_001114 [Exophiala xenobiotica]